MDIRTELHNLRRMVLSESHISDNAKEKIANRIFEIEKSVAINYTPCCKSDSGQLCEYCGLPLQEGVNLDYCKNDYCIRNDQHNCLQRNQLRLVAQNINRIK